MTPKEQDTALFAQLNANHPRLKAWLEEEQHAAVDYLTKAREPVTIHQSQGKAQFIATMLNLLVSAHKHLK